MLKAKDGEFFISDWLRNRNTVEFLGIWEKVHNPAFNYGGTYAHRDLACEFGMWISPEFKIYLIKEFQRLKEEEQHRLANPQTVNSCSDAPASPTWRKYNSVFTRVR